jgi:hypothetical protein
MFGACVVGAGSRVTWQLLGHVTSSGLTILALTLIFDTRVPPQTVSATPYIFNHRLHLVVHVHPPRHLIPW